MIAPVVFLHHFRLVKLFVHVLVYAAKRALCEYADEQADNEEQHKLQYVDQILILIQTGYRLAHCVYRVGEGEEQVDLLEEVRQQLNGV